MAKIHAMRRGGGVLQGSYRNWFRIQAIYYALKGVAAFCGETEWMRGLRSCIRDGFLSTRDIGNETKATLLYPSPAVTRNLCKPTICCLFSLLLWAIDLSLERPGAQPTRNFSRTFSRTFASSGRRNNIETCLISSLALVSWPAAVHVYTPCYIPCFDCLQLALAWHGHACPIYIALTSASIRLRRGSPRFFGPVCTGSASERSSALGS